MVKEYTGTPLVVQTDGGSKKGVVIAGFVIFLLSGQELVFGGRINAGSINNEAEFVVIS